MQILPLTRTMAKKLSCGNNVSRNCVSRGLPVYILSHLGQELTEPFSRMKEEEKLMNLIDIYKACHTDTLCTVVKKGIS